MSPTAAQETIHVTLPDGSALEVPRGTTLLELAERIGPGLAKAAVAGLRTDVEEREVTEGTSGAEGEEKFVDLREPLREDCAVRILTRKDPEALDVLRHSAAHVMAAAVQRLWPEVNFAFGPWVEDGFYYDVDLDRPVDEEDLRAIEAEMAKVVGEGQDFERREVSKADAIEFFEERGEKYKVERISELEDGAITMVESVRGAAVRIS